MTAITFFNSAGRPVAYLADDRETIFLFDGTAVGYLVEESVYSYSGTFLGWYQNGWILNCKGERVFYTDAAKTGPVRPLRQLRPLAALRQLRPLKVIRQLRPTKPVPLPVWAAASDERFFEHGLRTANTR